MKYVVYLVPLSQHVRYYLLTYLSKAFEEADHSLELECSVVKPVRLGQHDFPIDFLTAAVVSNPDALPD